MQREIKDRIAGIMTAVEKGTPDKFELGFTHGGTPGGEQWVCWVNVKGRTCSSWLLSDPNCVDIFTKWLAWLNSIPQT